MDPIWKVKQFIQLSYGSVISIVSKCCVRIEMYWAGIKSGMDYCNGTLDWTTRMSRYAFGRVSVLIFRKKPTYFNK